MQICMGCKQEEACNQMQAQNFQNDNPDYTQCRPETTYTDSVCRQCCKDNNCTKDPSWWVSLLRVPPNWGLFPYFRFYLEIEDSNSKSNEILKVVPNHTRRMGLHWYHNFYWYGYWHFHHWFIRWRKINPAFLSINSTLHLISNVQLDFINRSTAYLQ